MFTGEDTHWNTSNKIYGDNPQKINEREDALGLKTYSYAPQISAVMQSGNLYVYAVGNPMRYFAYYSSIDPELCKNMRVRDYISQFSFEEQYRFGMKILEEFTAKYGG